LVKYYYNPNYKKDCPERLKDGSCAWKGNCNQKGMITKNRWGKVWEKLNHPQPFWIPSASLSVREVNKQPFQIRPIRSAFFIFGINLK